VLPAWFVLLGLLLVAGNLRTAITAVGPVLPAIEEAYGLASTTASVLVSLPLLAFASVSPFAPRFARALGLERSIALALAMLVVGLAVRSVPPVALLWLGTALIGIAIAVLNVVLPALVKRDFPTKIGQVTGAYSAVQSSFAAIAAGVAVPVAGMSDLGWRLPLGMWAGLALITLGVLAPQLRRRTVPNPGTVSAPVVRGRSPWGSAIAWQVTGFMGLQSVVFYVFVTWLPAIEHSAGISEEAAGLHSFLLNAVAIGGSLLSSALIPRRDPSRPRVGGAVGQRARPRGRREHRAGAVALRPAHDESRGCRRDERNGAVHRVSRRGRRTHRDRRGARGERQLGAVARSRGGRRRASAHRVRLPCGTRSHPPLASLSHRGLLRGLLRP
jgi:cyanate permease